MWRFLAGAAAALLLVTAGLFVWKGMASSRSPLPAAPAAATQSAPLAEDPPAASDETREARRFSRYDHDRDGKVAREEFLLARRKAFARLDTNGDGRLSFDEYATKTVDRFASADADRSGALDAKEFATTRIVRKTPARCACGASSAKDDDD